MVIEVRIVLLELENGKRKIALIKGGKYNGKILRLYDPDENKNTKRNKIYESNDDDEELGIVEYDYPNDLVPDDFYLRELNTAHGGEMYRKIDRVRKAVISKKKRGLPHELVDVFDKAVKMIDDAQRKEITLSGSMTFIPLPQMLESGSERGYIAGAAGSGKSTYVGKYIEQYKKMFPGRPVWVFSRVENDYEIDRNDVNRMILNKSILQNPISPDELTGKNGSLCIFDDIDTIPDKKINDAIHKLRDDITETGRHKKITCLSTGHQLMNYKKTRDLLNESNFVTFFPRSGSAYHIRRFLQLYCGLDKINIEKILRLPSRWVTIYKVYPIYVISERNCYLIN